MGLPLDKLGTTYPSRTEVIDPDRVVAYADATNDPNEAYRSGIYAPPVSAVAHVGGDGLAVADIVPAEALMMVVHGWAEVG